MFQKPKLIQNNNMEHGNVRCIDTVCRIKRPLATSMRYEVRLFDESLRHLIEREKFGHIFTDVSSPLSTQRSYHVSATQTDLPERVSPSQQCNRVTT